MKIVSLLLIMMFALQAKENALALEPSLYLQQHKDNAVNWFAWNKETLQKAKDENKLIFLSIGYATCHWCHVMAHETFEKEHVGDYLNKSYISIKVDKEEMPDLDGHFQALHKQYKGKTGGWPLNLILTPDLKPIFIASYLPPKAEYGIQSFLFYMKKYQKVFTTDSKELAKYVDALKHQEEVQYKEKFDEKVLVNKLTKSYDVLYGGFSVRPKFPEASKIDLLFDLEDLGFKAMGKMAKEILAAMAMRGLYDHVEGGFYRYSVDEAWEIPHFEKMIYANAQLISLYTKAYKRHKNKLYKDVVLETTEMLKSRFVSKEGLYYSASDADSEGKEGLYFIFSSEELTTALKNIGIDPADIEDDLPLFENFQGSIHMTFDRNSRPSYFKKLQTELLKVRKNKNFPFIDHKMVTSYNAMMVTAFLDASAIKASYKKDGLALLDRILKKLQRGGTLYHQAYENEISLEKAKLEDYAYLCESFIKAYETTWDNKYLDQAFNLASLSLKSLYKGKGEWLLGVNAMSLYASDNDKYYTSAKSMMLRCLQKLALYKENLAFGHVVDESLNVSNKQKAVANALAIRMKLRQNKPIVLITSNKKNIQNIKDKLSTINYPFIELYVDDDIDGFTACRLGLCFAHADTFKEIAKEIEK